MENLFLSNKVVWRQLTSLTQGLLQIQTQAYDANGKIPYVPNHFKMKRFRPLELPDKVLVRRVSTVGLCFKRVILNFL